jgi:hypothetical protein
MRRYVHNVVYLEGTDRQVVPPDEPRQYPGSAADYARVALRGWLAGHPEHVGSLVVVNVWDADDPGAGEPGRILVQLSNADLDEGPFDPDQVHVAAGHYHLVSSGYDLFNDDPVLGYGGTDYVYGTPYGLIAPGEGPALRIRAGHQHGWIALTVVLCDAEPPADTAAWEAVEQVTLVPAGELRVADDLGRVQPQYPDLTGGRTAAHLAGHLAVRVSARGRDATRPPPTADSARRTPTERHRVEAWPVSAAAPRQVLKRDRLTRRYETTVGRP